MNTLIPKEMNSNYRLGYLIKSAKAENVNIRLCGALIGNCYIMAEMTATIMNNALTRFRRQKWYRNEIKKGFNESMKSLQFGILRCKFSSSAGGMYIQTVADYFDDNLRDDVKSLTEAITSVVSEHTKENIGHISDMAVISIMFACIASLYDDRIAYMKQRFNVEYEKYYPEFRFAKAQQFWDETTQRFLDNVYGGDLIDLTNNDRINDVLVGMQKKLADPEMAKLADESASEYRSGSRDDLISDIARKIVSASMD